MNRRPVLIALAVIVPVAVFVGAKSAASWRPVRVTAVTGVFTHQVTRVRAARFAVLVANVATDARPYRFDLATNEVTKSRGEGFTSDGVMQWQWIKTSPPQVALQRSHASEVYPVPAGIPIVSPLAVQIFDAPDHIEFISFDRYLRWNKSSRALERNLDLDGSYWDNMALTRDGAAIVSVTPARILLYSTRDGHVMKRITATDPSAELYNASWVSARGGYAGYETMSRKSSLRRCDVWDVAGARKAWSFERDSSGLTVLSSDEKLLAQADVARGTWQLYTLSSGARVRQLPLIRGTIAAAFSPDNATLYSAVNGTNGVLYRQRTR